MERFITEAGALGGKYKLPLSGDLYVFSRYKWASTEIARIFGLPVVALWLIEAWENEEAACDTINWSIFRKKNLTILAHPGEAEHEFALRAGNKATVAGALVQWRALPEELIAKIDQLDRETVAFRKVFVEELDFWPPLVTAGASEKSEAL